MHCTLKQVCIFLFNRNFFESKFHIDSRLIPLHHEYKSNRIENLTNQLKNILINGISRKRADEWRRRWFRVYAFRGQL